MGWFLGAAASITAALALGVAFEQVSRRRDRLLPLPGRTLDVGGYGLHVTERGSGAPTVVILHGAGDGADSWAPVVRALAERTRVLVYDRPGMGASDPGPAPDAEGSVRELYTLLERAGVDGPCVLVGHSIGGVLARLFALRHPERVAGIVFVDSSHESLKDDPKFRTGFAAVGVLMRVMRLASVFGLPRLAGDLLGVIPMYQAELRFHRRSTTPEEYARWKASTYRHFRSPAARAEFDAAIPLLAAASTRLSPPGGAPQLGDLPIVVLTNPGFGAPWIAMHQELATRSTRGVHRIGVRSGHSLQMTHPELVLDAVATLVEATRTGADWRPAAPA